MSLIDDIRRSRAHGNGAKGSPNLGLHYCSRCGRRGRTSDAVSHHISVVHNGEGEPIKEPSRTQLVAALLAAEKLAEDHKQSRDEICELAEWFLHRDGASKEDCAKVFADLQRARLRMDKAEIAYRAATKGGDA